MKHIGRILSANSQECVVSYCAGENEIPPFASILRIPLSNEIEIYGIITDVTFEEDGFLRQISGATNLSEEVIEDARINRNVPIVLRVLFLGYREDDRILHMLPPRPPVTLTSIYQASDAEITHFTHKLAYLRFLMNARNILPGELIASHIHRASLAHVACQDNDWAIRAIDEVIELLRDDPNTLMNTLSAVADSDIH